MRIILSRIRFSLAIGLLFAVSFAGCSTKHQRIGTAGDYYQTNRGEVYAAQEPKRTQGTSAMHHATLRGYTVLGKRYYPQIVPIGWRESGVASWYGPDFHGKKTSSGETYDMYAPATAAHKTLPMNTIVLVTHRQSGAQVKVRVNDRGPFVQGRIIDLSYTAGKAIGLDITGTAPVTIEVLEYDRHISAKLGEEGGTKVAAPIESVIVPLEKVAVAAESGAGKYAIQLGSFKNIDGANRLKSSALMQGGHKAIQIKTVEFGSEKLHRVLIGGFDTKAEAEQYMKQIGFSNGVIVNAS